MLCVLQNPNLFNLKSVNPHIEQPTNDRNNVFLCIPISFSSPYIERGENQCIPYVAPAAPQLFRIAAKREISNAIETRMQIFRIRAEKQAAL